MLTRYARLMDAARPWSWAIADRVAFLLESLSVAVAVLLALTWAMLGYDWQTTAHEWGSFWSHYAKASAEARRPVEIALLLVLAVLWIAICAIRAPKSRLCWAAWPIRSKSLQEDAA